MKNNIKLLVLLFSFGFFLSCDDELNDLQPFVEGNPETFFNSVSAFQNGVDGAYKQLWNYYSDPGSGLQGIPDILADNVILVRTGRTSNSNYFDYRYVASTGGAIDYYWSEAYEAVNVANLVIAQIDNLGDGEDKDNILGQALAIRAWAHFDLVRIYGKIPTQSADANSSLGITYIKVEDGDTEDPFAEPTRETVASNYAEIIGDLERASQLIGEDNGQGKLNTEGVYALLSRVYLYNGEYQKVIDAANEVSVPLATAEELEGMYTDANEAGIVVKLAINTSSESSGNNVGVLYSQTTSTADVLEYAFDFDFYNSIDEDDQRLGVISYIGENSGNQYNAINKFLGETGEVNGRVDVKVMRAAEVLLNKAEAQYELGQDALTTLNELRDLRYVSYDGGESGQDLEDAIQFERRVELSFEGHRFFDLKRRGESVQRSTMGDIIDGSGTPPDFPTLDADNFRFQLPIPIAEINANQNMVQNPGY
ncbi:MAG: RagB/SusD family nutrient uptake outer membrane protein [Maribacter dokdonensis]|uniref:RagB/SusD family nutrient uptake outer membrane protein n=1 Tax=Maribacter TaxID=252356 RepID=UPI000E3194A9|nr:RagB/SusD family nutrient uptake outer membrane protein [Maribacter litoralis]|eukprot:TRINITY_DN9441_c0_g1_i1.p2 TRINITY_DN9441_c0_g1~~TRINITY_DN9441_c0_g1_i1.p2  ORF type:complete len:481 (-),score=1.89 TRINITY_DN9441_c0_g1_i1:2035-3477(-)